MSNTPTAAIIIIGNEILSGQTQDVNIAFLAQECAKLGIKLREARVIADIEGEIISTVKECSAKYSYVFTTGGIGPTHDDITSESVSKAFGKPYALHPEAHIILQNYYKADELNEARLRMAYMPEGAAVIENPISSAPGFQIGNVFVLAGVPSVMQAMFKSLQNRLVGGPSIQSRILSSKLFEGQIAKDLEAIQKRYPAVDIGSYPGFRQGGYMLRLVLRGTDAKLLDEAASAVKSMIISHGGEPQEG